MQGFVKGSLWGLVVGSVGLGCLSLVTEQPSFAPGPAAPQLAAPALEAIEESPLVAFETSVEDSPTFTPAPPLGDTGDVAEAAPEIVTQPADPPPTAEEVATAVGTPEVAVIELGTPREDDAASNDTSSAPSVVMTEAEPEPTAPVQVVVEDDGTEADSPAQEVVVADAPAAEVPTTDIASVTDPATQDPAPTPQVAETRRPAAVTPELPQTNRAVRINRPGAVTEEVAEATVEGDALTDDRPALLRFAADFENPNDLPLISIILIDTGAMDAAPSALSNLGFVPTVAVNALSADAADGMAAYRAAGIEVAMLADLPEGAQPVDVEVAFEAAFAQLPEVAMLFSTGSGALQNRAVTAQVLDILTADGRGFVTVQRGLGNAARAAAQEGIPVATILRDLDGAGEDSRAITRALDQAAFRARQSGDAVLLGRLTQDTLDTLRAWAADLDRETLAIAPVSAVLLKQVE